MIYLWRVFWGLRAGKCFPIGSNSYMDPSCKCTCRIEHTWFLGSWFWFCDEHERGGVDPLWDEWASGTVRLK